MTRKGVLRSAIARRTWRQNLQKRFWESEVIGGKSFQNCFYGFPLLDRVNEPRRRLPVSAKNIAVIQACNFLRARSRLMAVEKIQGHQCILKLTHWSLRKILKNSGQTRRFRSFD